MFFATSGILTILCSVLAAPAVVCDDDVLAPCPRDSHICGVDELTDGERGSSLLQVELQLQSDKEILAFPMGSLALLNDKSKSVSHVTAHTLPDAKAQHQTTHLKSDDSVESTIDSVSLMQSNVTTMTGSRHLLGTRGLDITATLLVILFVFAAIGSFLFCCTVLLNDETSPAAEGQVMRTQDFYYERTGSQKYEQMGGQKYQNFSPAAPERMGPQPSPVSSPLGVGRTSSSIAPSLLPTATFPQSDPQNTMKDAAVEGMLPPPTCAALILETNEARFKLPIDQLKARSLGPLDINGTSGKKLLHASLSETPDNRRCLAIASIGCESDPRVSIFTPEQQTFTISPLSGGVSSGAPATILEVYGKAGDFYGTLEPAAIGGMLLKYRDGRIVMAIQAALDEDLRMTATSYHGGRFLGSAGREILVGARKARGDSGSWRVQVQPGVDAVLVLACMMSIYLLAMPPISTTT